MTIDEAGTRSVIVFEDSATSFTCKSTGSRPKAVISWIIGSDDDMGSTTSTSTMNQADQGLRDTKSTLQLIPKRRHHNQLLRCVACAGINQNQTEVRLIVYGEYSYLVCTIPHLLDSKQKAECGLGHIATHLDVDIYQMLVF